MEKESKHVPSSEEIKKAEEKMSSLDKYKSRLIEKGEEEGDVEKKLEEMWWKEKELYGFKKDNIKKLYVAERDGKFFSGSYGDIILSDNPNIAYSFTSEAEAKEYGKPIAIEKGGWNYWIIKLLSNPSPQEKEEGLRFLNELGNREETISRLKEEIKNGLKERVLNKIKEEGITDSEWEMSGGTMKIKIELDKFLPSDTPHYRWTWEL